MLLLFVKHKASLMYTLLQIHLTCEVAATLSSTSNLFYEMVRFPGSGPLSIWVKKINDQRINSDFKMTLNSMLDAHLNAPRLSQIASLRSCILRKIAPLYFWWRL